jgi:hypothetical protein
MDREQGWQWWWIHRPCAAGVGAVSAWRMHFSLRAFRSVLQAVVCAAPGMGFGQESSAEREKKGWGGSPEVAVRLKAHWSYNWGPKGESRPGVEFVPMVKGKGQVTPEILGVIKGSGAKVLLGFNEPERRDQGNTTVAEALDLWPKLMDTGLRLGSPAPSSDSGGMAWLDDFMKGVEKRKLRVDFIAVHWYRSANVQEFEAWLRDLHRKYHRPIWITEFDAQYSGGDRDRFALQAFKMLDHFHDVERYSYFTTGPGQPGSLWKAGGDKELSPLGEDYVKH